MWRRLIFSPHPQQQQRRKSSSSSTWSPANGQNPLDYCIDLVRQRDRESYLCSLLLPPQSHLAAFAVRAFNVELATIRSMVSNQTTALMRFQFWKSTLDKIFDQNQKDASAADSKTNSGSGYFMGAIPEHPVAETLAVAVQEKKLSRKWLSELIDARIERLDERRNFQTIKELEDFYQRTFGAVFFLLLEANNVRQVHADHAASHLAKALGIVNGLRAINADPERNVNILPLELLLHHRVSQQDVVRLASGKRRARIIADGDDMQKRLRDMTYDLASQAHVHLEHARKLRLDDLGNKKDTKGRKRMYEATRLVLLPAAIGDHYLQILRKVDFDILHPKIGSSYDWLALTLWWRKVKKSY